MTDYFQLLQIARSPCLDPDTVQSRFIELSTPLHPDRVHQGTPAQREEANSRFSELNRAQQTLRDPVKRLRHLLELELGRPPADVEDVSPDNIGLFVAVAQKCRTVDAFLEKKRQASSPMLKAQLFQENISWVETLQSIQKQLVERKTQLDRALQELAPSWDAFAPSAPANPNALPIQRLSDLYRTASFLARATRQIEDRIVNLSI